MTVASMLPYDAKKPLAICNGEELTPVQMHDLAVALALSEDVSPCPAAAHTALLILRSTLARALHLTDADLLAAAGIRVPNLAELPTATDQHNAPNFEAHAQ
ncbi:hypothetical protein [Stenotrophomonas oahuensis]|uniref:Uncharacterized protein n=1 Tax=Stenotrophomonas oahuensis TaxID=3003271 RepID=A0ABY9YV44_9GAMM|nr:hypothetical protein [Stenotrophomonas sp. A5586]WNH54859.1 hypothetical protein PDM29_20815 [Stenotrophomonas sp. A5586]